MKSVIKTSKEAISCKISANDSTNTASLYKKRKTALLNRVYLSRSKLLHKIVQCSSNEQILILGAGFDVSFDNYSDNVFVIDFPEVLNERREVYNTTAVCVPGDLREPDNLFSKLITLGFNLKAKTTILLECVLCYIDHNSANTLLYKLSSLLAYPLLILYDPILSHNRRDNSFASVMYQKFENRGAPLLSCATSVQARNDILYKCEWIHVYTATINEALRSFLTASERCLTTESMEPFDEYASLALLNDCYGISIASKSKSQIQYTLCNLLCSESSSSARVDCASSMFSYGDYKDRLHALEARLSCAERRLAYACSNINNTTATEDRAIDHNISGCDSSSNDSSSLLDRYILY